MARIELLIFGQLTDITGSSTLMVDNPGTIAHLRIKLIHQYPALGTAKFVFAMNNKIVGEDTVIEQESKIALMPPFSGG
jgi:sulfur-carrier protein